MNKSALNKLGYGLYVLTTSAGGKDNGCITNSVMQITGGEEISALVSLNKQNFSHDMIKESKKLNVSVLTTDTPFDLVKHFGFQSGATVDKFADFSDAARSTNGVYYLAKYTNAYLSIEVNETIDCGTHTLFIGRVNEAEILGDGESLTYDYYHKNIKPQPQPATTNAGADSGATKTAYRCTICGYVYEGEELPEDFICPLCKHGTSDFVKI